MIKKFLKYIEYEKRYSPHTIISYHTDLQQFKNFLATIYPELTLVNVDYRILRSWIVSLVDNNLENTSINRKIASLRSFYKFLLKREQIQEDPTWKLKVLKKAKKLPHYVNEEDMTRLLDQLTFEEGFIGQRDMLVMEMLYGTGIRLSELIGLTEQDVNFNNETIKVLGKRNKERIIPFSKSLGQSIKRYLAVKNNNNPLLITADNGEGLYPMLVYRIVKKY